MKKRLVIYRPLSILLATCCVNFSLVGCDITTVKDDENISSRVDTEPDKDKDTDNINIILDDNTSSGDTSNIEQEEFDYFASDKEEIRKLIVEKKFEEVKAKGKEVFVKGVDFIFYDQEISGISFSELTEEGKRVTLENLHLIDANIECLVPGYKDTLKEQYVVAGQFIDTTYLNVLDKIKDYLGEDNYQALTDIKNQIKDDIKEQKDKGVTFIKKWYEDFRK